MELFALGRGVTLVYSSIRNFKTDLQAYKPTVLFVVPRLLEALHKGIKEKLLSGKKMLHPYVNSPPLGLHISYFLRQQRQTPSGIFLDSSIALVHPLLEGSSWHGRQNRSALFYIMPIVIVPN